MIRKSTEKVSLLTSAATQHWFFNRRLRDLKLSMSFACSWGLGGKPVEKALERAEPAGGDRANS